MRLIFIWSIGIFVPVMLMKLAICLSGWLGVLMNLRLVVLIFASPRIPNYAHPVCENINRSDYDSNSSRYYISANGFVRLSSIIETMDEQHLKLTNLCGSMTYHMRLTLSFAPLNLMATYVMIVSLFLPYSPN